MAADSLFAQKGGARLRVLQSSDQVPGDMGNGLLPRTCCCGVSWTAGRCSASAGEALSLNTGPPACISLTKVRTAASSTCGPTDRTMQQSSRRGLTSD